MFQDPTTGVKGAKPKPRFKSAKEELPKLSRQYLIQRNEQMRAKNQTAQLLLAKARDELIEKRLVEQQAGFLLVSLRQRVLNVPHTYARRILNISDPVKAKSILREAMLNLLTELKDLPSQVVDPHWLTSLEDDDGK